jgi:hypothetical protein
MIEIKINYPEGVDYNPSFEKMVRETIKKTYDEKKEYEVSKESMVLELNISSDMEISSVIPEKALLDSALKKAIDELKKELEKWK